MIKNFIYLFLQMQKNQQNGVFLKKWTQQNLNFDNYSEIILDHSHDIEGLVINPFGKSYIISEEWLSELRTMKEERLKVRELKIPVNSKILIKRTRKISYYVS